MIRGRESEIDRLTAELTGLNLGVGDTFELETLPGENQLLRMRLKTQGEREALLFEREILSQRESALRIKLGYIQLLHAIFSFNVLFGRVWDQEGGCIGT